MMPFTRLYDKATSDIGLRHVEWYEEARMADYADEVIQASEGWQSLLRSLIARLTSRSHPTPSPEVRRHPA